MACKLRHHERVNPFNKKMKEEIDYGRKSASEGDKGGSTPAAVHGLDEMGKGDGSDDGRLIRQEDETLVAFYLATSR
jgi:hypothetical protein